MEALVTFVAQYLIFVSVAVVIVFFFKLPKETKKQFIIEAVVGGALALILAKIGSALINDPRPFVVGHFTPYFPHGDDNGFPSDHTLLTSFLGYLVLRYDRRWGIALLVLAALIGLSRVIAGVHHLTDIIGSFVLAGIAMAIVYFVEKQIKKSKATPQRPDTEE